MCKAPSVFDAANTTSDAITADYSWLTSSFLADVRDWELDMAADMLDVTTLSTTTAATVFRSFAVGLQEATATIDRIASTGTTGPAFFDRFTLQQDLVVELHTQWADKYEAYARVASDSFANPLDALTEEAVTLQLDGLVGYSTI